MILILTNNDLEYDKKNTAFSEITLSEMKEFVRMSARTAQIVKYVDDGQSKTLKDRYGKSNKILIHIT